jgi:hypothetical protein
MTGAWHFNKELSTMMPEPAAAPDPGADGRRGPGGGGGRGGRGGGGGGGGRSYGGGRGEARPGGGSTDDLLKARALSRDLADVASVLTIIASPTHVTITNDRGTVRKFTTDDLVQDIDLGTAHVTAKTKWDEDLLTQEWVAGKAKFSETYQVTVQGHMLVVRITAADPGSGSTASSPVTAKYVFDRVE